MFYAISSRLGSSASSPFARLAPPTSSKARGMTAAMMALGVVILSMALDATAQASVILEKLPAANPFEFRPAVLYSSAGDGYQKAADNFTLGADQSVTAVRWYGNFGAVTTTTFDIQFFADNAGLPALSPFFSETVTGVTGSGSGFFDDTTEVQVYEALLGSALPLSAGQYWLSVRTANPSAIFLWHIAAFAPGESTLYRDFDNAAWTEYTGQDDGRNEMAFALLNNDTDNVVVPAPAALGLMVVGLATLSLVNRRRRTHRI